jgi:hypothetical protein
MLGAIGAGGAALIFFFLQATLSARPADYWVAAPCRIITSTYAVPTNARDGYRFVVAYRYRAGGTEYISNRRTEADHDTSDFDAVRDLMETYPPGAATTCYVSPTDPAEAILERPQRPAVWVYLILLIPAGFVGVSIVGIRSQWKSKPRFVRLSDALPPRWAGWVASIVMLLMGAAFLAFLLPPIVRVFAARSWAPVDATIIFSRVQEDRVEGPTYGVDVLYGYDYRGRHFVSNRYALMGGTSTGRASKAAIVARFAPGAQVKAWLNPSDPQFAVLDRGFQWSMLWVLLPLVFVLIGIGGLISSILAARPGSGPELEVTPTVSSDMADLVAGRRLLSSHSRRAALGKTLPVALIWGSIVGVIAGITFADAGPVERGVLVLFLLIGVHLLLRAGGDLLRLGNPSITLLLEPAEPRLGEPLTAHWRFTSPPAGVRRLVITLRASEVTTRGSGRSRRTGSSDFLERVIVDTTTPGEIGAGEVTIILPPRSMHSFESAHNRIVWTLEIWGQKHRWCNIEDDFEINVRPAAAGVLA